MITWMSKRLLEQATRRRSFMRSAIRAGRRPRLSLASLRCAELVDQPIMIFHVSTAEGAEVIRAARGRGSRFSPRPARNISH